MPSTPGRNQPGKRFCITKAAVSGSVDKYHWNIAAPAKAEPMPSQASLVATSFLNAASLKRAATMPPTTAVIVNMNAVRMPSWAKVLGP